MGRIKYKWLNKVAEYRELKPVKMIYLDIGSQNKPSYVGSKNWIFIQDSYTKKNGLSSRGKNSTWLEIHPFFKENEEYGEKCQNNSL